MTRLLSWFVHCVKITTLLLSPKNVIDAVRSEGILNQIGNLRRKMTIIDDGHVGIWARHARRVTSRHCRVVTRRDGPSGIWVFNQSSTSLRNKLNTGIFYIHLTRSHIIVNILVVDKVHFNERKKHIMAPTKTIYCMHRSSHTRMAANRHKFVLF